MINKNIKTAEKKKKNRRLQVFLNISTKTKFNRTVTLSNITTNQK